LSHGDPLVAFLTRLVGSTVGLCGLIPGIIGVAMRMFWLRPLNRRTGDESRPTAPVGNRMLAHEPMDTVIGVCRFE
jgi:hypothetical protein